MEYEPQILTNMHSEDQLKSLYKNTPNEISYSS